jgi:hypothetical protein
MKPRYLVLAAVLLLPTSLSAREWTDVSGRLHSQAEYVDHDATRVWVRNAAGKVLVADRERLSAVDRKYVADLERVGQGDAGQTSFTTLALRKSKASASASHSPRKSITNHTLARLTGWHCDGGHCHIDGGHPHVPHHPCPVPEDKGKRIMKGCYSTFHLVDVWYPNQPEYDGTGAYKFVDAQGCCHQYLELLKVSKQPSTNFDLYFKVVDSTPALTVTDWYFQRIMAAPNSYHVFYSADGGATYVYYDTAHAHKAE